MPASPNLIDTTALAAQIKERILQSVAEVYTGRDNLFEGVVTPSNNIDVTVSSTGAIVVVTGAGLRRITHVRQWVVGDFSALERIIADFAATPILSCASAPCAAAYTIIYPSTNSLFDSLFHPTPECSP